MVNIVIPMAGAGSRFAREHWCKPKPFIDVMGKPMIEKVLECLRLDLAQKPHLIFIIQSKLQPMLESWLATVESLYKRWSIVTCDTLTEGAACSVLLAKRLIDNPEPMLICNSDQWFAWPAAEFWASHADQPQRDMILCFHRPQELNDTKWSYVRTEPWGRVTVKEKQVISSDATVGVYYWAHGYAFVEAAERMIAANDRVNNEFYVAPVYNYCTSERVQLVHCTEFHGLGVPQDLVDYLAQPKGPKGQKGPKGPKGLVFDLDGVLVESKQLHYQALRQALLAEGEGLSLEEEEHRLVYDGLSTRQKLVLLSRNRGLPEHRHNHVFAGKQRLTLELTARHITPNLQLIETFRQLKRDGFPVVIASNCIRASVDTLLTALGLSDLVDVTLSNEDVPKSKPFGDMYVRAATSLGCQPSELLVFEDSPTGFEACIRAGCALTKVDGPHQLTYDWIMAHVAMYTARLATTPFQIVMPMAGLHLLCHTSPTRPPKSVPWHLVDVACEPLINHVTRNLIEQTPSFNSGRRRWIFIVTGDCDDDHRSLLYKSTNWEATTIITTPYEQCGAVSTIMLASAVLMADAPLLVHDNRHLVQTQELELIIGRNVVTVHDDISQKCAYAEIVPGSSRAVKIHEKKIVGMHACTGIYSFSSASAFIDAALKSLASDSKHKYFVSQVYNHLPTLAEVQKVDRSYSLRTQQDIEQYVMRLAIPTPFHDLTASTFAASQRAVYCHVDQKPLLLMQLVAPSSVDTYKVPNNYNEIVGAFLVNHLPRFTLYAGSTTTASINLSRLYESLRLYMQSIGLPVVQDSQQSLDNVSDHVIVEEVCIGMYPNDSRAFHVLLM